MAVSWTLSNAIASLRRRLSDGPEDKYRHQMPTHPSPDGRHRRFAVPDSHLVRGTLQLFLDGERIDPTTETLTGESTPVTQPASAPNVSGPGEVVAVRDAVSFAFTSPMVHYAGGYFEIEAPDEGHVLVASYYFQWFTDADLTEFLEQAIQLLHFDGVTDDALPTGLRTPILSFAAYFAYIKMAGLSAQALSASATGFTADSSKEHPYWMNLANAAWEEALKSMEVFNENPVSSVTPVMRFVSFRMQPWVPRS